MHKPGGTLPPPPLLPPHARCAAARAHQPASPLAAAPFLSQRDLKPQNLLLSEASPDATLKIADFGFARNLQPQARLRLPPPCAPGPCMCSTPAGGWWPWLCILAALPLPL